MTRPKNSSPTAAQFTALKAFLVARGFTAAQLTQAIGGSISGRSRQVIAAALRTRLQSLPKGSS